MLLSNSNSPDYKVEAEILYLKKKDDFYAIKQGDIVYIESNHVYCKTVTKSNGEYLNIISLNEYNSLLNDSRFIRPHRSYLANVNHITKVNMNENVLVMGQENVPISRSAKKEMKSLLNLIS